MEKLILIGGGGHCKSCIDVIEQENKYEIAGVLDIPEKIGTEILGYKIIGTDDDIEKFVKQGFYFLITVGHIKTVEPRLRIYQKLKDMNAKLATVVSPRAYISKHATIGEGSIIMNDAIINAGANVAENCIINNKAILEHDCQICKHSHVSTSTVINGEVIVGEKSFIGSNATVVQCVTIPPKSFVKAGSLVK